MGEPGVFFGTRAAGTRENRRSIVKSGCEREKDRRRGPRPAADFPTRCRLGRERSHSGGLAPRTRPHGKNETSTSYVTAKYPSGSVYTSL